MKILKRLKRIIDLSKKDPKALEILENLTPEQLNAVPEAKEEGDGKAVFIGEGTHEEFIEHEKEESGLKPWYDLIKKL